MKLTFFVQYFPPDQSSGLDLVQNLLEGFADRGWDINLYTPTPTRGVSDSQRREYCKRRIEKQFNGHLTVHRMPLYREGKGFVSRAVRYVIFSVQCFWKALTIPADFVFTGSGPPSQGVVVGLARKLTKKKKFIYNLQDVFPDSLITSGVCDNKSIAYKIGRKMEDFSYRNADLIITITEDMKENVIGKGVNPRKVEVIRNWIDVDRIRPVSPENNGLFEELDIPSDKFYVVYAGNLGKVQGAEVIIKSAEFLKDREDIHFVIFGNGSEEEVIKKQAEGLQNVSVFPLQPMNRVSEVYSLGDVAIIPCRPGTGGSGMPSKTWAIMATGTPIIASFDLGGEMEQTIKRAQCGYTVEAGDEKAIANIIELLKNNPAHTKMLGQNARRFACENVSKKQAVQRYIDLIEKKI